MLRSGEALEVTKEINDWVSTRLKKISFQLTESSVQVYFPDQQLFLTFLELEQPEFEAEQRAEQAQ